MTATEALDFPRIDVTIRSDGSGEVTINGTSHPVQGNNLQEARVAAIERIQHTAQTIGRPVLAKTTGPDGQWTLKVSPDGTVHDATAVDDRNRRNRRVQAPEPAAAQPMIQSVPNLPDTGEATMEQVRTPAAGGVLAAPEPPELPAAAPAPLPTLNDLMSDRPSPAIGPAELGWQGAVRRWTGGLIKPTPGAAELLHRESIASVQRSMRGPRTIAVINPKGGAHKTTATMLLAATFGIHRGGYTLAWDNNETRGTLGWRGVQARHTNTAVDLLDDLDRFNDPVRSRVGDLDNYVRSQGSSQFDVLASDEDAAASANIDAEAFQRLHSTLSRFYRLMIIDTGNNMRASNWVAAVEAADQLVIVSTVREDTAASAAWLLDGLRARGFGDKIANAVTLLSAPSQQPDEQLNKRLHRHFAQLTRQVVDVPHDTALVDGGTINFDALAPATREAWLRAAAVVAEGL